MPEALRYDRVALRYEGAVADAVGPVSLSLRAGERVVLLGPSGSGKSSLLHAATGLFPKSIPGTRHGDIRINGQSVDAAQPPHWATSCGFLFQDAAQTLAGFTVGDEIAFGLENRCVAPKQIARQVAAVMRRVGIPPDWTDRRITTLSGGERQYVALAALLAQGAPITLADEPAASLAPMAARRMVDLVLAPGHTTLAVEHKPGPILDRIDRCVALGREGRRIAEGTPKAVIEGHAKMLADEGIALPLAARLHLAMPDVFRPAAPLAVSLSNLPRSSANRLRDTLLPAPVAIGRTLVELDSAACAPAFGPVVLRHVSLRLRAGEVLAILGPNGAGKSTLAACLAGLVPLRAGTRTGPMGAVAFQNPEAHFSRESVRAELAEIGPAAPILRRWGLARVADQHPFTLSQGQKRRLALALLAEPDRWPFLVLDEPTAGLDGAAEAGLGRRIQALARDGRGIALITHDLDFALSVADRALLIAKGGIRFDGLCPALMRDRARIMQAGLLPPEAAPCLDWLATAC